MIGSCKFINDKKDITSIYQKHPVNRWVIIEVAHSTFPNAIKIKPDQIAFRIEGRTAPNCHQWYDWYLW